MLNESIVPTKNLRIFLCSNREHLNGGGFYRCSVVLCSVIPFLRTWDGGYNKLWPVLINVEIGDELRDCRGAQFSGNMDFMIFYVCWNRHGMLIHADFPDLVWGKFCRMTRDATKKNPQELDARVEVQLLVRDWIAIIIDMPSELLGYLSEVNQRTIFCPFYC